MGDGDRQRVVVVTGASSGIGRASALAFAAAGCRLVLAARSRAGLERVAMACRARGAPVRVVPADLAEPESLVAVAATAVAEFGGIDVWVDTAAVMAYGRFEDVPADVFEHVVRTDLLGAAAVARTALHRFRAQGHGVLIFGGSLLGTIAAPYMSSYVTSKWGLRGLVRVLRQETRDAPDIHVCLVAPGAVDTPIYRNAANFAGRIGRPPPPIASPHTVARAILRCATHPRATVTVGWTNRFIRFGFVALPGVYDALVGPLMRAGGLSREPVAPHRGNVFEPLPTPPDGTGGWTHQTAAAAAILASAAAALTAATVTAAVAARRRR
ncbi:SDR family NAD(P)-dependent oxidoreductase [Dactylosporangium sp. NPDC051541]|uniref:SDR family NAD(P)-dependent oxidoreductase n=1 Tax=Dactylosporangium sp. NPDC051541 TaxID=3363977 RepID=UPI0037B694E1